MLWNRLLNMNYKEHLVNIFCWKYARLAPTGKLFFVCAAGGPDCEIAFGEMWFNKINLEWKKSYSKIVELRKKLFQEGEILKFLKQKPPNTNPSIKIITQPTSQFGKYRGDLATFFLYANDSS